MRVNPLGRRDRTISAIGLDGATFGREIDEQTSFRILDYAVERGIMFFDTAEAYGGGNAKAYRREHLGVDDVREATDQMSSSELILGRWLAARGCHEEVTVCTKVGTGNSPENIARAVRDCAPAFTGRTDRPLHAAHAGRNGADRRVAGRVEPGGDGGPRRCHRVQQSQRHPVARGARGQPEVWLARFEAIENIYNLAHREAEEDVFPVCDEHEVSFITYSPLGAGFLTGKYTPDRDRLPAGTRFHVIPGHCDVYFSDEGFRVVEQLRARSEQLGESMAYLAGARAVRSPHVACTLFGARTIAHVDNGVAALEAAARSDLFEPV